MDFLYVTGIVKHNVRLPQASHVDSRVNRMLQQVHQLSVTRRDPLHVSPVATVPHGWQPIIF